MSLHNFNFDNSYAENLEGFYVDWKADNAQDPGLLKFNSALAGELGLDLNNLDEKTLAELFSGNLVPDGAHTLAQVYAGHQFGGFSPQLGDGRALLIGEIVSPRDERFDIQLKGSGRTPFSRGGDGKAAIGPVLREYLMAEAMHALRVPTTRALAAVTTGEYVFRERPLPGAVLTRVASSHVRVGTFQFFASRGEMDKVCQLADYVIWRHYPALETHESKYTSLLQAMCRRQAELVAKWMSIGFIHGVMNTDNMTLSGETIDYGPCAFMDTYDPKTVFSSIDEHGRYAYGNQPVLAQWNLARLAECLVPLIDENREEAIKRATEFIEGFSENYETAWLGLMRKKLGLHSSQEGDLELARGFLETMQGQQVDFTLAFRSLSEALRGYEKPLRELYQGTALLDPWLAKWRERIALESDVSATERASRMDAVNPLYIPRNHKVEEALSAAENGDMIPFEALFDLLQNPYDQVEGMEAFAKPASDGNPNFQTFCGT
ncbi:MAG: YdiU family protein [Rhizobiaceae bacterium]|nr:YdiU family protein [Rhizobiaceae bacterium]